jgi:hypothetical protein
MSIIEIGRLLRASTTGCVVGCKLGNHSALEFGGMVVVPLDEKITIYGLIHEIHIDDDGLVRQLVNAENINPTVIADNRLNRNVPLEAGVLFIGHSAEGHISFALPPRPPLSLDAIYPLTEQQVVEFTSSGHFSYFRHILRVPTLPIAELLSAHIRSTARIQVQAGHPEWLRNATQEVITLLRDDYAVLNTVLNALADIEQFN